MVFTFSGISIPAFFFAKTTRDVIKLPPSEPHMHNVLHIYVYCVYIQISKFCVQIKIVKCEKGAFYQNIFVSTGWPTVIEF